MRLTPGFDQGGALDQLRLGYASERLPHVVVPRLFPDEAAEVLRDAADLAGFTRYEQIDRGRFEENRAFADEELFAELRDFAAAVVERPLKIGAAGLRRLSRGDYALIKCDARDPAHAEPHLEATLDFSAGTTDQAEIVFTDGSESWPIPQLPGSLCLVTRTPGNFRYERYLNLHAGDALVYRLRLSLLYV